MSRFPDAATLLERALLADAAAQGIAATIPTIYSTRWASATFVGARHVLALEVPADAADWLAGLGEADLPLRRHLLADLAVVRQQRDGDRIDATIEALTVEER